jgi:uncharacterized repeat protein (TIGR01451 family)
MHAPSLCLVWATLASCVVAADAQQAPPQPAVAIQQKMPEHVVAGAPISVEICVSNTGATPADNLVVSEVLSAEEELLDADPLPERIRGTLSWSLGRLEPGSQKTLRLRLTLKACAGASELRNSVTATYQVSVQDTAAARVDRLQLALEASGPEAAAVGEKVVWQFVVRNTGSAAASGVTLHTLLPQGLTHPAGPDLEKEIGDLAPGASRTITLQLVPTRAGTFQAGVRVLAQGVELASKQVSLQAQDVRLSMQADGPTTLPCNGSGSYTLRVSNEGTASARSVRLVVALPEGLAFLQAGDHAAYDAENHAIIWNLGDLGAGEKRTVTWTGVAKEPGDLVWRATLCTGEKALEPATWTIKVARGTTLPPN